MFDLSAWMIAAFEQAAAIISAFLTLIVFHKIVSPKVIFSEFIRSAPSSSIDRSSYSIKIAKSGAIDLIDVRLTCRLYVKDIFLNGSKRWSTFPIPVTYAESAVLGQDDRIIHLSLHTSSLARKLSGKEISFRVFEKYGTPQMTFEKIMLIYRTAYLRIDLLGNDRFTGVLKVYRSNRYGLWAFRNGNWEAGSVKLNRTD